MHTVTPIGLGLVQRQVGVFEQFLAVLAIVGEHADANARGHDHAPSGQLDRRFHFLHDALSHLLGLLAIQQIDQHAELIAAKPCDHVVMAADRAFDMSGNYLQ
ncbi:hypothetical protein D3C75_1199930 [compost metagenome]